MQDVAETVGGRLRKAGGPLPLSLVVLLQALLGATVVWLLFPARADYVAHFLAGEAMVIGAFALAPAGWNRWVVALAPAGVVAASIVGEMVRFGPTLDGVDIAVATMGAVLQAGALFGRESQGSGERVVLAVMSGGLLIGSVAYRYSII